MRRILLAAATLAGTGLAVAATGPVFDGEVLFDPGIERHDELETVLHDWVRETMADARREAGALAGTARENGTPFAPVEHEIRHRLLFESPEIVSVLRQDHAYAGGAHGSIWLVPVNWDVRAQALIPIEAVLGDPERDAGAYARAADMLREAVTDQVWGGSAAAWDGAIEAAVQPDPSYLSVFTFVPSTVPGRIGGIAWHFEPAVVAPAAEGVVSVVIPQSELRDLVDPDLRTLFDGEPADMLNARSAAPADRRPRSAS